MRPHSGLAGDDAGKGPVPMSNLFSIQSVSDLCGGLIQSTWKRNRSLTGVPTHDQRNMPHAIF